jgi:hypothetical protein
VSGKSSIYESTELIDVPGEEKKKENVTIIKRVTERTLEAQNVYVSI